MLARRLFLAFVCAPNVAMPAVCPNQTADGKRMHDAPSITKGGWRGRDGFARIRAILARTRFDLHPSIATDTLWVYYWLTQPEDAKRAVPVRCKVCGEQPTTMTIGNLVASSRCSAQCSCTLRPTHATLAGRRELARTIALRGFELVMPADGWEAALLRTCNAWRFVHVRCVACGATRHDRIRGIASMQKLSRCACRVPRRAKSLEAATTSSPGSPGSLGSPKDAATGGVCARRGRPPFHISLEGRARLVEALADKPYELSVPSGEWVAAHAMPGSDTWRFLALRCTAKCRGVRHVKLQGLTSIKKVGRCRCTNTGRQKRVRCVQPPATARAAPGAALSPEELADVSGGENAPEGGGA